LVVINSLLHFKQNLFILAIFIPPIKKQTP
jgi:hypothetical protein